MSGRSESPAATAPQKGPGLFSRPLVENALRLALRALDRSWAHDPDLGGDAKQRFQVMGEIPRRPLALGLGRRLRPCLDHDRHFVEPTFARKLDLEMRRKSRAVQDLLLDLRGKDV